MHTFHAWNNGNFVLCCAAWRHKTAATFIWGNYGFYYCCGCPVRALKSTLTRLYALWLVQREMQEISFSDTIRNDKLQIKIEECAAQNYLLDDYHITAKAYTRNKYRDRLDQFTRMVSGSRNSANIFVTSESLKGSSIFSAADRMLQIYIRRMTDEELFKYKSKLSEIPDYAMSMIALNFVQSLLNNY